MSRSFLYFTIVFGLLFSAAVLHIWTAHANGPVGSYPIERASLANNEAGANGAPAAAVPANTPTVTPPPSGRLYLPLIVNKQHGGLE